MTTERDIERAYQQQERDIEQWRASEQAKVEAEAKEAEAKVRKYASETERQRQEAKQEARTVERKEQRKRDLPYTKPKPTNIIEKVKAIEASNAEAQKIVKEAYADVAKVRKENIAAVNAAAGRSLAELDRAKKKALTEYHDALETYNKDVEAQLANYAQLSTGEYVSRAEYNKLGKSDPQGQAYLMKYGVDRFNQWAIDNAITISAEGIITEGNKPIPQSAIDWAKSKGYMTIEASGYVSAPQVSLATAKLPTAPQSRADKFAGFLKFVNNIYKPTERQQADLAKDKRFSWLSAGQRDVLISMNNVINLVRPPQPEADLFSDPKTYAAELGKTVAVYTIPFVWTVDWNSMTTTERIINGAIDVFIIATLGAGAGLKNIKIRGLVNAAKTSGAASNTLDDALKALARTNIDDKAYATVANNAQKAIQASRVADTKFIDKLLATNTLTASQLASLEKNSGIKGLKNAIAEVSKAQTNLKTAWAKADKFKFGTTQYINQLDDVAKAQARLNAALSTFNTKIEPRFKLPPSPPEFKGYTYQYKMDLLPKIEQGLPNIMPLTDKGKGVQLAVLEKTAPTVTFEKVATVKLTPAYAETTAKKAAATVAPKVAAGIDTKLAIATLGKRKGKVAEAEEYIGAMTPEQAARISGAENVYIEAIGKPISGTNLVVSQGTAIEINASPADVTRANVHIANITSELIKEANKLSAEGKTASDIKQALELKVKPLTRTITQTKVRTLVETKIDTIIDTAIKYRNKIRLHVRGGSRKFSELTATEKAGSVCWKQGFIYILIYPPYGQANVIYSRKPFPGIPLYKGARSAYKSIIRKGGKLPPEISRDMGIMDIHIKTTKGKEPKLTFERDIKQRTKLGKARKGYKPPRQSQTQVMVSRLIGGV